MIFLSQFLNTYTSLRFFRAVQLSQRVLPILSFIALIYSTMPVQADGDVVSCFRKPQERKRRQCDNRTSNGQCSNIRVVCKTADGKRKRAFVKDDTRLKSAYLDMIDSRGNEVSIRIDNPEGSIEDYARRNLTQTLKTRLKQSAKAIQFQNENRDKAMFERMMRTGRYRVALRGYELDSGTSTFTDVKGENSAGNLGSFLSSSNSSGEGADEGTETETETETETVSSPTNESDSPTLTCKYEGEPQIITVPSTVCDNKKICVGKVSCELGAENVDVESNYNPSYVSCSVKEVDSCPSAEECRKEENYNINYAVYFSQQPQQSQQEEEDTSNPRLDRKRGSGRGDR